MANNRLCSISDCGKPHHGLGFCRLHHARVRRHGNAFADIKPRIETRDRLCSVDGCNDHHLARGLCYIHYGDIRRRAKGVSKRPTKSGDPLRFLNESVLTYAGDECLPWPFGTKNGYGQIEMDGKHCVVSRVVCEMVHGPAPTPKHDAAHSCGKGHEGCCSPNHLSWKTRSANNLEKREHGTMPRGETHHWAKLTEGDVALIRGIGRTRTQLHIANLFGVTRSAISAILTGRTWV